MKRLHDPDLDPFRDGVAELRLDGELCGHVASTVVHFWGLGRPFTLQERVFLKVTWTDGSVEVIEDYPTWSSDGGWRWTAVDEMQRGVFVGGGEDKKYAISWLADDERTRAWDTYGPRDDDPVF